MNIKQVLLFLFLFVQGIFGQVYPTQAIRVGIHSQLCGNPDPGLQDQIQDSTIINFARPTFVSDTNLRTNTLSNYDVILLSGDGGTSIDQISPTTASDLLNWVFNGGGLVIAGWTIAQIQNPDLRAIFDPVAPVKFSTSVAYCAACQASATDCHASVFSLINATHPMVNGMENVLTSDSWCIWSVDGLNNGIPIASISNQNSPLNCLGLPSGSSQNQAAVVKHYGSGRVVYLCGPYCGIAFYAPLLLRIPQFFPDQILERGLFWAANLPSLCTQGCVNGVCTGSNVCTCNAGWTGPSCTVASCSPSCQNSGVCSAPNVCDCTGTGYSGSTCTTPVCTSGCSNGGTCTGPDTCTCPTGWTGPTCGEAICTIPCQNNGICYAPDLCDCRGSGGTGNQCQNPVCSPACFNQGTCVTNGTCNCLEGWDGNLCQIPICDPSCVHGTCVGPDRCICEPFYTGETCDTPICSPPCVNGFCSDIDVCTCDSGWNATDCSNPICSQGCPETYVCIGPDNCYGTTAMQTTQAQTTGIPQTTHMLWRFTTVSFTTDEYEDTGSSDSGFIATTAPRSDFALDGNLQDIDAKWIGIALGIGLGVCLLFCCVGFVCAALARKRQVKNKGIPMEPMAPIEDGSVSYD